VHAHARGHRKVKKSKLQLLWCSFIFVSGCVRQIAMVQAAGWTWSACASQSGESEAWIWHESISLFQP